MIEIVNLVRDWRPLLVAILIFGFAPGAVLRLVVRAYPKGHPRREELVAELYEVNMASRPFWVAQQFETALFEGIPARAASQRKERSGGRSRGPELSGSQIEGLGRWGEEDALFRRRTDEFYDFLVKLHESQPSIGTTWPAVASSFEQLPRGDQLTVRRLILKGDLMGAAEITLQSFTDLEVVEEDVGRNG